MEARTTFITIGYLAIASCATTNASSVSARCDLFTFEDEVAYHVQSDAVKTLNAYDGWFGAPEEVVRSMEITVPNLDQLKLAAEVKSLHLSAFFRPLQDTEVECQQVRRTGYTRCYVDLVDTPLQLSGVFHVNDEAEFDAVATMNSLAERVKVSALDCT